MNWLKCQDRIQKPTFKNDHGLQRGYNQTERMKLGPRKESQ
jgi:hypothetical protein